MLLPVSTSSIDSGLWSLMPGAPLRRRDFASATMIGVLMSATLPARLGEPARALALARHTGQTKENLPVVVGTLVSQTFLNLMSLLLLGLIIVSSTDLFHNSTKALFTISLLPLAMLLVRCARASPSSSSRASRFPRPSFRWEPGRSSSPPAGH